jgi:hypothetical protein
MKVETEDLSRPIELITDQFTIFYLSKSLQLKEIAKAVAHMLRFERQMSGS